MTQLKNRRLLDLLLQRTRDGGLDWQESFNDGFQVSFKDNSVRITHDDQNEHNPVYSLLLLNGNGDVVDRFTDEDLDNEEVGKVGGPSFHKMKELYSLSLRHARGADKVLNEILKELDDDIPF
jgi:hypothetical protein